MKNIHESTTMLTLQHLYIIEKIISEGSVTRASEKLNLTQSALSHQIRDLETVAGLKLFNRIGKKLVLSEAGQKIVSGSEKILPIIRELEAELEEMRLGKFQTIRISTECYTCYHWLPPLLADFNREYPNINVQIVADATRRPMEYLETGQLELAIVSHAPADARLHYEPLFDDEMVVLMSSKHPLAIRNTPLETSDLNAENLIAYFAGAPDSVLTKGFIESLSPQKITPVPLTEAIVEMVRFGMGVTVMASWVARQYEQTPGLSILPFRSGAGRRTWYACTRKTHDESLTQLVKMVQEALQSQDQLQP
ncbi:MAG: LysR family transcriptional regulator [Dyadobacter sp.]|uniref:LysR family transcriptional regulator n=1 Tax=Dyadobacter sp. TaxID=1914288 RepID=UPI003263DED4